MLLYVPSVFAGQLTNCVVDGKNILLQEKKIGKYNGKYIIRLPDLRGVGRRDGQYIVRLSDRREACRQDGKDVINVRTGKLLGQGVAAALCFCAGLLD